MEHIKRSLAVLLVSIMLSLTAACSGGTGGESSELPTELPSQQVEAGGTADSTQEAATATPETTSEQTASVTQLPTEKPTNEPKLVFAEDCEFPEYDDAVYEKFDAVTLYYPEGNPCAAESGVRPFAIKMLLPKGWTLSKKAFDGLGYFPNEYYESLSIVGSDGGPSYYIYDENGQPAAMLKEEYLFWNQQTPPYRRRSIPRGN